MARAIPGAIGIIPGDRAAFVRAGSGNGVRFSAGILPHRDLVFPMGNHTPLTGRDIVDAADP
jgi:hypothetical protein